MKLNKIINKSTWFELLFMFESGHLNHELVAPLFQFLTNQNIVWQIQGTHGSTAAALIDEGMIVFGEEPFRNGYGMVYPSRYELTEDEPGSLGYQKRRGYKLIRI